MIMHMQVEPQLIYPAAAWCFVCSGSRMPDDEQLYSCAPWHGAAMCCEQCRYGWMYCTRGRTKLAIAVTSLSVSGSVYAVHASKFGTSRFDGFTTNACDRQRYMYHCTCNTVLCLTALLPHEPSAAVTDGRRRPNTPPLRLPLAPLEPAARMCQ